MKINKFILVILALFPLQGTYAESKDHIRDDDKYYYSYWIDEDSLGYYIANPIIKEGDFIHLELFYPHASEYRYCKGMVGKPESNRVSCIYNGTPFKRTMNKVRLSEGYTLW